MPYATINQKAAQHPQPARSNRSKPPTTSQAFKTPSKSAQVPVPHNDRTSAHTQRRLNPETFQNKQSLGTFVSDPKKPLPANHASNPVRRSQMTDSNHLTTIKEDKLKCPPRDTVAARLAQATDSNYLTTIKDSKLIFPPRDTVAARLSQAMGSNYHAGFEEYTQPKKAKAFGSDVPSGISSTPGSSRSEGQKTGTHHRQDPTLGYERPFGYQEYPFKDHQYNHPVPNHRMEELTYHHYCPTCRDTFFDPAGRSEAHKAKFHRRVRQPWETYA